MSSSGIFPAPLQRIPAVLGVADATKLIPDGATVEVDPRIGDVRIVN